MFLEKWHLHEMIQSYLDTLYTPFNQEIRRSRLCGENETYGEIYYYSAVKLLNYLNLSPDDHFLDIGSGIGKLVFQVFLISQANFL